MRLMLSLSAATTAAILFLGCGSTDEVSQPQGLAISPTATVTPTPTVAVTPTASAVATATPTAAPSATPSATLAYTDTEYGFSLQYPTFWTVSEQPVAPDQAALDVLKITEFFAKDSLPRLRLMVGDNPNALPLAEWIEDHDPIFFDTPPEDILIDGLPSLFQPLALGQPRPHAYVGVGAIVLFIDVLAGADFDAVASTIRFE